MANKWGKLETVTDLILGGSNITAGGDCGHESKKSLLLGRKVMINLDSFLKQRHYFVNKSPSSQSYGFSRVMYGCESWIRKKVECRRTDAFELWCWRRLLRVPWTARRSNQSNLRRSVLGVHWKNWCWSWNSNISATWCEELTHLKRPWF